MPPTGALGKLDSKDLLYAVQALIAERKVTPQRILALAARRAKRIAEVQSELLALRAGKPTGAAPTGPSARRRAKSTKKRKRRFTMTPKARAARKLQGRYLGLLRKLDGAARTKVKALASKSGVKEAVKLAAKLAK